MSIAFTLSIEHCSTRGRIPNDEMPAFSDSAFAFSSDSNSLVQPPVETSTYAQQMARYLDFCIIYSFVVVTFLSARVELMKFNVIVACNNVKQNIDL